ncbi:hypothetical protein PoB_003648100 [Plakobranchus ocellatus]|uniref:Uncharacterized protein n=1 Tax=Plakobranchus ocellatus TaxID=259542 RepID=A0AAV4ATU1_9GAST|nr:hypothetical protein PoB_003648100 [Plakobranchus ocellatus]
MGIYATAAYWLANQSPVMTQFALRLYHKDKACPSNRSMSVKEGTGKSFEYQSPGSFQLLSSPPLHQGAGGWARIRDRRVPADLRAHPLATVPPTPQKEKPHCKGVEDEYVTFLHGAYKIQKNRDVLMPPTKV